MSAPTIPPLDLSEPAKSAAPAGLADKLAKAKEKKEETKFQLTPRARKATKQLFKELGHVKHTTVHMQKRIEQTLCVVSGVKREMNEAADSVAQRLKDNKVMHQMTKPTRGGAGLTPPPRGPGGAGGPLRQPNETERIDIIAELRNELEEGGEERDPTDDEIQAKIDYMLEKRQQAGELKRTTTGQANTPVVEALEKLESSARVQAKLLEPHEAILSRHVELLKEMVKNLQLHETMRDDLFDPVKTNEKIERSVLYQKMNPMAPLPIPLEDKDESSAAGRIALAGPTVTLDPAHYKLTGHEATHMAAEREDTARADCLKATAAVRAAQTELARRKSQLQVSVNRSRQMVLSARRAAKAGNFGSSGDRNTDPATRKMHRNPEDPKQE